MATIEAIESAGKYYIYQQDDQDNCTLCINQSKFLTFLASLSC